MRPATPAHHDSAMKAIVQEGYGSPEVLHLREIDRPVVGADSVLVRVRAASVNALDSHFTHLPWVARVVFGLRTPRVRVRGVDLAGEVEAVGKNVTRFKPGDEVFGAARGTFAEFAATSQDRLAPMPRGLTFAQAAAVPVAGLTALQGLRDRARVAPGQRVLVYGAGGGVGTFAVQIAKAFGAHVTAVTSTGNVDLLRSIGADEVVDYTQEDFTQRRQRYDVFFDVGGNRSLRDCRRVLESKGTLVLAGAGGAGGLAPLTRALDAAILSRFVRQRLLLFMAKVVCEDLVVLKDLLEARTVTPVVDRQVALSGVPGAIRHVREGRARGKVVIDVA